MYYMVQVTNIVDVPVQNNTNLYCKLPKSGMKNSEQKNVLQYI